MGNFQNSMSSQPGTLKAVKVLVVDDSALMRKLLTDILSSDADIDVVGAAEDAYQARDMIKQLHPDVLTLDIEMPRMDGIQFLRNLMRLRPMPVVMISTHTTTGAGVTLDALEIGAVDFIAKPKVDEGLDISNYRAEVIRKVKAAGKVTKKNIEIQNQRNEAVTGEPEPVSGGSSESKSCLKRLQENAKNAQGRFILFGSSTGGTEALKVVLKDLPADSPPVLITQHIPPAFSASFAQRLDSLCSMNVYEAKEGMEIETGSIYLSPGDKHLEIAKNGLKYCCHLDDGPPVNQHKPSVEKLFLSAEKHFPNKCTAIMLTGMGDDGAQAMKTLRDSGAHTIAQDEETSVVWGMPGQAVKREAVVEVSPLQDIAKKVLESIGRC
ncbi:MAG: protein-glutamate methylesterase/protein-glutamine glutaminase [Thiotrichales bacterium]